MFPPLYRRAGYQNDPVPEQLKKPLTKKKIKPKNKNVSNKRIPR
jgi:hypothetical protein